MADTRWTVPFAQNLPGLVRKAIESDTDGLRTLLLSMMRANAPVREVFIKPNKDGSWPTIQRGAGAPATLMWLRSLDGSTLAPMPTAAVGYLPGDLVFPADPAGGAPAKGVYASDTLMSATIAQAQDYTGETHAGGQPITWAVDKTRGAGNLTDRRARIGAAGLDVYDGTYVYSTYPAMPTGETALRSTFTIAVLAARNEFAYEVRGVTPGAAGAARVWFRGGTDGTTVTVAVESGGSTVDLGSVPFTAGTKVVIDDDGVSQVRVTVGANTVATGNVSGARGPYVAFYAGPYSYFTVKNFTVEVV